MVLEKAGMGNGQLEASARTSGCDILRNQNFGNWLPSWHAPLVEAGVIEDTKVVCAQDAKKMSRNQVRGGCREMVGHQDVCVCVNRNVVFWRYH